MKFYLAPMEGITTYIYRNALHRYYGGVCCYYTPFLSNKVLSSKEIRDICPENNEGLQVIPQIMTNNADTFVDIANTLQTTYNYHEVNLNLGCPSGTVVAKKRGAGFLSEPDKLDQFLDTIFSKCPIDISIKTRIGIESEFEWEDLLNIYKKYPIKELIIHPRFQKEFYKGKPHWDSYKLAVSMLSSTNIPLCYNGDITSMESYDAFCKDNTTTQAIMIGRGLLANPCLALQLLSETADTTNTAQLTSQQLKTFADFHEEILAGYIDYMSGQQPVLFKMKELWSYMGQYVHANEKQLKMIRKTKQLAEYKEIINRILQG